MLPVYPSSVMPLIEIERVAVDGDVPTAGSQLIVRSVALMDTVPEKFGDEDCPLPVRVAELVVIVYVPAGSVWPLSVRPSVVSVMETFPATVAE